VSDKPWVKTYSGGKANYCTPVDGVYISEECVQKSDKSKHEGEQMQDPTLEVIEMQQALTKIQSEMRMTGRENLDTILLLSGQIRERLIIVQEWVLERKESGDR
jgi:hypothetical protein